jgi:aspartyl/asparaginyl beta-hydroxylase (cupin superfamily)
MSAPWSYTDILTDEERMAWHDRDHISFYEWYSRWFKVTLDEARGIKTPRHRYNKENPHMP